MYRHLFSFTLPVELCSGRPNCGATQSFGENLVLYCLCSPDSDSTEGFEIAARVHGMIRL